MPEAKAKKPPPERGAYRPIYRVIVDTPEFQDLSPEAKLLWYTLKMKLGAAGIGVVYDDEIRDCTGLEEIDGPRKELLEGDWLITQRRVHWLRNGLRYEPSMSMKNEKHRTNIESVLSGLPRLQIVLDFAEYYGVSAPYKSAPSEGLSHRVSEGHSDRHSVKQRLSDRHSDSLSVSQRLKQRQILRQRQTAEASKELDDTERDDGSDEHCAARSVDGLELMISEFPDAGTALTAMTHRGGEQATSATLRNRFLYVSEDVALLPDKSVQGLDFTARRKLVAAALLELRDQGEDEWKPPLLAGYIRRIRNAPDPDGDHPGLSAEDEERTETDRREAARAKGHAAAEIERLNREGRKATAEQAEARDWLDAQPTETQDTVAKVMAKSVRKFGYPDPTKAPPSIVGSALLGAVREVRGVSMEPIDG